MKQIWKWIIVIPIIVGIIVAISISVRNQATKQSELDKLKNVFGNLINKNAEVTAFYTYGTSLNVEGRIKGVSKDNFEGIKLQVTDGSDVNNIYNLDYSFEDNNVVFSSIKINDTIKLDELSAGKYYVLLRLKVNNSRDYKYYTLTNISDCKNIEYYTLTKDSKNNKISIRFNKENYNGNEYSYLGLNVEKASNLPEDVYDIVVDPGHGGKDSGEVNSGQTESNLMLEYGKALKEKLEAKGYKVKLTRDESNNDTFTDTNMYDEDGRISIACSTRAKYMISLHTGESGYTGIQVFVPNNVDLKLAEKIASNIYINSNLDFSNSNEYKLQDGVYQKNYNKDSISRVTSNLEKQGIEPYNLTTDTPALYTIREVGGLATNAYVDGRNPNYSANKYYNSNQGIECYQISIGRLKYEKEIIEEQMDQITSTIADCF